MLKNYNSKEELNKENLIRDNDFLMDASVFLQERDNIQTALRPEEIYDKFMEHMRYQDVNEITALRDLEYAQNSDESGKQRFGRLIDAYDKVNTDFNSKMLLDYAQGVATAPSTYLGLITGGTGKVASIAGTQATKLGIRKLLSKSISAIPSVGRAMAVEGAIGAGQGAVQESTRVETGVQDEYTGVRTAVGGLTSAIGAGALNVTADKLFRDKAVKRANEMYERTQLVAAKRANEASKKSKDVLLKSSQTQINEVKNVLDALDPTKVKIGRMLKQDLSPGDTMTSALGPEVVENISAAAIRIKDKIKLGPNERITAKLADMIAKNEEQLLGEVGLILDDHNLTPSQFSLVYLAEISDAGKILGIQSRASTAIAPRPKQAKNEVEVLIDNLDQLEKGGKSAFNAEDAVALSRNKHIIKDLDSLRLGMMTTQPATTMRNNLNGGMRVAIDAATRSMDNLLNLRNPLDGTLDVAKYLFNPYEAKVMRQLFSDNMPEEAAKLFRDAADIAGKTSNETALATIGRKANFLNTMSDNMFKQAVLSASLKRRLSDSGQDIYKIIEDGDFGKISDDIMKNSIQDAYEFTYQSSIKGDGNFAKLGRGVLSMHQNVPFLISSFMPFPRYIANQFKFLNEYMPLVGLLDLDKWGSKKAGAKTLPSLVSGKPLPPEVKERIAKQLTGTAMLGTAYMWRLKQGETEYWYDINTSEGNTIDGRALYGPFAPFMLAADLIYRYQSGTLPTSLGGYMRDTAQALLGSTFRAGLGLYALDSLYQDAFSGKLDKVLGESLGNVINTYTMPVSIVKDFYSQFDAKSRRIPETSPALEGRTTNLFDIIWTRGTRAFPDFPANGYDTAALSPFQTGDLTAIHPIEKQLFGFNVRKGKNALQKEMARLNITPYDMYKRPKNNTLDLYTRQELSNEGSLRNLNEMMELYMDSKDYTMYKSPEEQRVQLIRKAKEYIGSARNAAISRIEAEDALTDRPYNELDLMDYQELSEREKQALNAEYQREFGGKSIMADSEKTLIFKGKYMNVLTWAGQRARRMR